MADPTTTPPPPDPTTKPPDPTERPPVSDPTLSPSHGEAADHGQSIFHDPTTDRATASLGNLGSVSPSAVAAAKSALGPSPGPRAAHRAQVKLEARKAQSDIGSRKAYNRDRAQAKSKGVKLASYSTRQAAMGRNRAGGQRPS